MSASPPTVTDVTDLVTSPNSPSPTTAPVPAAQGVVEEYESEEDDEDDEYESEEDGPGLSFLVREDDVRCIPSTRAGALRLQLSSAIWLR